MGLFPTPEEQARINAAAKASREKQLRDQFAAQSLPGVIAITSSTNRWRDLSGNDRAKWIAETAWSIADAMMAEREPTA